MTISGYTAVNLDMEIGGEEDPLAKFAGVWNETFLYSSWNGTETFEGEVTVSVDGDRLYFENMFNYTMWSTKYSANYYGTLSDDGTTVTLVDANGQHNMFGPLSSPLVMTVEGNTLKAAAPFSGVSDYVLTNPNMGGY